jgi:hypothetical protein
MPTIGGRSAPPTPKLPFQGRGQSISAGRTRPSCDDEPFYDAASIAAMRIGCLPGNARNAVAMAAIAANTQADKKT